ncbi:MULTISPECIES: DUF983 domain-containing protein [Halocynthiibacter]|uniref:DUF983 domain-containing protein n=1 Tax=Halocynthiibacter halioticoli TaxID=2986804 RepID=A0AAE3IZJ6_9RHOB|nr:MULTISPECIES: DUF983 domain-containing protein [Halocynthiibacter]MCV6824980.1 DUF983 domain-containing protein [Halocynthiibacter halioticoli]MCW4057981.1 DUF983 domain-containing protein [Halocynthiibacter sp. SDUM655004]MDE0588988.1 DUF983 domain-containing protein [Halocynthiibacter sp. C4]
MQNTATDRTGTDTDRPVKQAIMRGWKRKCPNCGSGPILMSYLKVRPNCAVCNEELYHQRADDGPAYLTILVVGHIMAPLLLAVFTAYQPDPFILAGAFSVGCVALSLYLLPRFKGAMIGIQWAKRMHGFGTGSGQN